MTQDKTTLNISILKQTISLAIQDSNLPVGVVQIVLENILNEISTIAQQQLEKEYSEYKKEQNEDVVHDNSKSVKEIVTQGED